MGMSASQARLMSMTSRLSDLELRAQTISNAKVRLADQAEGASRAYSDALDKQTMKVYSGLQADGTSSYVDATLKNITSYSSTSNLDSTNSVFRYIESSSGSLVATNELVKKYDDAVAATAPTAGSAAETNLHAYLDKKLGGHAVRAAVAASGTTLAVTAITADQITAETTKYNFLAGYGVNPDATTGKYDENAKAYKYYSDLYAKLSTEGYTLIQDTQANSPEWLQAQVDAGNIFLREYDKYAGADGKGAFQDVSWTSGDSSLQEKTDKTDTARAEADYESAMASIKSKEERFDLQLKEIDTEHTAVQTEMDSVKKVMSKNIERTFKIFDA